jgi:CBS domain-containing protein
MKRAKDIMTTDVVYLSPEDSILDAAKFFAELDIHGVVVLDDKKLVGILTVSDIIRFLDLRIKGPLKLPFPGFSTALIGIITAVLENNKFKLRVEELAQMKVKDFMSTEPITIRQSTDILRVAKLMNEKNFHRLPVVSRGKVIGMVTASDLMKALIEEEEEAAKKKKRRIKKAASKRQKKKKTKKKK